MRILLNCWLLFLLLSDALARAGGGGGGGGHGGGSGHSGGSFGGHGYGGGYSHGYGSSGGPAADGMLWLVLWLVVAAVVAYYRYWSPAPPAEHTPPGLATEAKRQAAASLLAELARQDARWNPERLTARVEEVFFRVQEAWTANNQDLARDCMSLSLYTKHKAHTDRFLARGRRNVLADITLGEVIIYSVSDHRRDDRDTFMVQLSGAMIDYQITRQGKVLAGNPTAPESFTEIWKFRWGGEQWVLDRIRPSASPSAIERGVAYSHKLRRQAGAVGQPPRQPH